MSLSLFHSPTRKVILFFACIFLIVGGYFLYNSGGNTSWGAPEVVEANFSLEYGKIEYDTKYIDMTLSMPLDQATIRTQNITITPSVSGSISLYQDKTIRLTLDAPLDIGTTYSVSLAPEILALSGKPLKGATEFQFTAVSAIRVTNILPTGKITNTNQNIIVTFSTPMIPLTNLDEKDELPCPLVTAPEITGQCKWLNGSTLEFIPDEPLLNANRYQLSVVPTKGLIYELQDTFTGEILTPPLRLTIGSSFDPQRGIILYSNAPITADELQKYLTLYVPMKSEGTDTPVEVVKSVTITPYTDDAGNVSETRFIITLASDSFFYGDVYNIRIKKGLHPKYTSETLAEDISFSATASSFLESVQLLHRNITLSGTEDTSIPEMSWLVNTLDTENPPDYLPFSGAVLELSFAQEVELDPSLFSFATESGRNISFSLEYKKDITSTGGQDDTKKVLLVMNDILTPSTSYVFTVRASINPSLKGDVTHTYSTAPKLELRVGEILNNRQICLISNLPLPTGEGIVLSGQTTSLTPDIKWEPDSVSHWCNRSTQEESYILNVQLNPQVKYSLLLGSGVTDIYTNRLGQDYRITLEGTDIQPDDMMIYSSFTHFLQVIPSSLPLVVNFLSANSDSADVTVCTLSRADYLELMRLDRDYDAGIPCTKKYRKTVPLTNHYWAITPNKFDLETDIIGRKTDANFIYVKGSVTETRSIEHLFIRSNLSLTLEKAGDRALLFATSLDGKTVPKDLTFKGYYFSQGEGYLEAKVSVKFIAEKNLYEFSNPLPDILFVQNDTYFGVINQYQDHVSNYDFRYLGGQDSMTRNYLYLYTDRPLYRAGDTLSYKGLLRRFTPTGYTVSEAHTGTLEIRDENGNILLHTGVTLDTNSNFDGSFSLPKDVPSGRYIFGLYIGEDRYTEMVYTNGEFYVSDYKKPVFAVNMGVNSADAMIGDTATLTGEAVYYFGGNIPSAEYTFSVLSQDYYFNAGEYGDYQFGNNSDYFECLYWGICTYNDVLATSETGSLDEQGIATFSYEYPKTASGEKIFSYSLTVKDPDTKKTVTHAIQQVLHTTDAYVGIKVPYWGSLSEDIPVKGVVLDYNAEGIVGKTVTLELWKREWKEMKKEGVDGFFYNTSEITREKESTKMIQSGKNGEFTQALRSATGGEYEVRALYTGENGETFISTTIIYIDGGDAPYWQEGNNSIADMTADETIVNIGDTAYFTLKSPVKSGKMFISIEKDDAILEAYTRDITSTTERIEVPITEAHIPNIYVKVFLIGQNPDEKLPTYKRALSVVKVTTDSKKLNVTITPEKPRYLPGEKVDLTIAVTDSEGNVVPNANGSLVFVDESLLALMGNPLKNPFAFFYDMKRYLGVETYISLLNLIEKLEVKDGSGGEKGGAGDGQKGGLSQKTRGVFRDTAFWYANFTTDANGVFHMTTDALPDNLTTWAIESIVSTTEGNKIGLGTSTIQTSKAVMIQENLPRFLGEGDRIMLSPVIFNRTEQAQNFTITLTGTHYRTEEPKKVIWISAGESVTASFGIMVEAGDTFPQGAEITFRAVADETGDQDTVTNVLPILATTTSEATATVGKTTSSIEEHIALDQKIRENEGSLTIHYGATLLPSLISGVHFLQYFPYSCAEQQTSALMPGVILKQVSDRLELPFDLREEKIMQYIDATTGYEEKSIDTLLREYLATIRNFQKSDGGFSFWKDDTASNISLTIGLLHSWSRMQAIGYTLDEDTLGKAIAYVKTEFYKNKRAYCTTGACSWSTEDRYRAVEAILDINPNDYEAYKMYKLISDPGQNTYLLTLQGRILMKLTRISDISADEKTAMREKAKEIAHTILANELVFLPRGAYIRSSQSLITTAQFLGLVGLLGDETRASYAEILDQMERWVTSQKESDGSFGSTSTTLIVLESLLDFIVAPSDMDVAISLDDEKIVENTISGSGKLATFTKALSLLELTDTSILNFEKTGSGALYYDMSLEYTIPAKETLSRDEGFLVIQEYYDYDTYLKIRQLQSEEWEKYLDGSLTYKELTYPKDILNYLTPLDHLTVGKLVYVGNTVITGEDRDQVAFEGFIPAGVELVNPNFQTEASSSQISPSPFSHVEWRDDRYFGSASHLSAGKYTFGYLIRPTHIGIYEVRPTRIFEFYFPEVFGRTGGKEVRILSE